MGGTAAGDGLLQTTQDVFSEVGQTPAVGMETAPVDLPTAYSTPAPLSTPGIVSETPLVQSVTPAPQAISNGVGNGAYQQAASLWGGQGGLGDQAITSHPPQSFPAVMPQSNVNGDWPAPAYGAPVDWAVTDSTLSSGSSCGSNCGAGGCGGSCGGGGCGAGSCGGWWLRW